MMRFLLVLLVACRPGYRSVRVVEEEPAGYCKRIKLAPGEYCEPGARDFSAGATVHAQSSDDIGGTAWFRWPLFDVSLDERQLQRGDGSLHHSIAGGVGTHLRPLAFWPHIQRYVDVVINGGFELGFLKESRFRGRGDAYVGGALDLFVPDIGGMSYLRTGIPGVRIGARYTAFVEGWNSETTVELGLIWRWGVPIDLYHHWKTQRGGD
jgi:hypothetical protein